MNYEEVRRFQDKTVTLRLSDGEVSKVKILFVFEEYQDLVADIIETTNKTDYKDPKAAYVIPLSMIETIEEQ